MNKIKKKKGHADGSCIMVCEAGRVVGCDEGQGDREVPAGVISQDNYSNE